MVNLERNFEGAATPSTASRSPSPVKRGGSTAARAYPAPLDFALHPNPANSLSAHAPSG
jgi:hypothetical protein